jgi:hypothetical protein
MKITHSCYFVGEFSLGRDFALYGLFFEVWRFELDRRKKHRTQLAVSFLVPQDVKIDYL